MASNIQCSEDDMMGNEIVHQNEVDTMDSNNLLHVEDNVMNNDTLQQSEEHMTSAK